MKIVPVLINALAVCKACAQNIFFGLCFFFSTLLFATLIYVRLARDSGEGKWGKKLLSSLSLFFLHAGLNEPCFFALSESEPRIRAFKHEMEK